MTVDISWPFNGPVAHFLFLEAAFVAYKGFQFAVLVFAACDPVYFIAVVPKHHFTTAFGAVAVGVIRLCKPYPAFETEGIIGERAHRANIDHIAGELIINRFLYI